MPPPTRAKQTMDQQEAAEYADIAINGMRHLYFLNPSEFYERKIKELETFVRDIPLSVRFTVVSWIKTVAGMQEGAPMPNVEAWAYYGQTSLTVAEYETDKNLQSNPFYFLNHLILTIYFAFSFPH